MHSRNKHQHGYDFNALCMTLPELSKYLIITPKGTNSIDFSDSNAVICLNKALLMHYYAIKFWSLPEDFLCPPVPGRADYIHALADLLDKQQPCSNVTVLDIGTGANIIYPLLGNAEYQWQFVGSDINPKALKCAKAIVAANHLNIKLIQQHSPNNIFKNVILPNQYFDLTMCNPPFHSNQDEAIKGTQRKWQNLKQHSSSKLNFGGQNQELWCDGGERKFIKTMIKESKNYSQQVGWFTCLVSKKDNLSSLKLFLKKQNPKEIKVVKMDQGQKVSRFLAWRYASDS
ncbi:Ribosomal RNA large subunit methyltransferase F [Pseudoalteromonas holothuriae]|uniref:Ribosomal RNA large subunit methyltransferase F n=1 Tax=Pseudoalteromonas holothuriae TaxID=2963714 RepID=A0A9W4VX72_9GAMM|nr:MULTISPECIES: 23S rRNA (adenine(1618)-N(6))-methyltransferase RlmF [unclassified Pseudoalteromonas]CAH9050568.1 Ribosomal RNA large subunit methyltransferase F [Pseudoalteromonas sp. CIP111951]CAH9061233.1 Ribosomal RNA large subunit methyltransferase F [Pseudoalteromonas sp. CIP111854]